MPIRFRCAGCDARMKVPDGSEGRRVRCPRCGKSQGVPGGAPESPETREGREAPEGRGTVNADLRSGSGPASGAGGTGGAGGAQEAGETPPSAEPQDRRVGEEDALVSMEEERGGGGEVVEEAELSPADEALDSLAAEAASATSEAGLFEAVEGAGEQDMEMGTGKEGSTPAAEDPDLRHGSSGPASGGEVEKKGEGAVARAKGAAVPPAAIPLSRVPAYDEREPERVASGERRGSGRDARPRTERTTERSGMRSESWGTATARRPVDAGADRLVLLGWLLRVAAAGMLGVTLMWVVRMWAGPGTMTLTAGVVGLTLSTMAWTVGELALRSSHR